MLLQLAAIFGQAAASNYALGGGTKAHLSIQPDVAQVIWQLTATSSGSAVKGFMQNDGYDEGDAISWGAGSAFVTPQSGWSTLYVRLTNTTNAPDTTSNSHDGSTWHALTEDSGSIWWTESHDGPIVETCTVLVEMATDSGGINIVASGSYTSNVSAEV